MKTRRALVFVSTACVAAACGSRTGLLVPDHLEAGVDAMPDAPPDVTEEPPFDAPEEPDAIADVTSEPDVIEEDVFVPPDGPDLCPEAGSTLIYVITGQNTLLSFYPPTATFTTIGTINCPDPGGATPFSMAVDRQGVAYVVFGDGNLFRVSTRTAACGPTGFVPGNHAFPARFGMGFSADGDGGVSADGGETLYLAGDPVNGTITGPARLGSLDVSTFQTRPIATVVPTIRSSELTGTGGGLLYGFYPTAGTTTGPASIGLIDKTTGQLVSATSLPSVDINAGWAFAFWGGDFYMFTAPDGVNALVQRYRPSDGTVVTVASYPQLIVGAGVSTCAPQM